MVLVLLFYMIYAVAVISGSSEIAAGSGLGYQLPPAGGTPPIGAMDDCGGMGEGISRWTMRCLAKKYATAYSRAGMIPRKEVRRMAGNTGNTRNPVPPKKGRMNKRFTMLIASEAE